MKKIFIASLVAFGSLSPVLADTVRRPHVELELLSQTRQIQARQTLLLGIRIKPETKWHVYWRNPGDSGEAIRVDWRLPGGFHASPILWPAPKRIPIPPLVNFGYDEEVFLLSEVLVGGRSQGETHANLAAEVSWLVCEQICIPGKATLNIRLPWTDGVPTRSLDAEALDRARERVPSASAKWKASASANEKNVRLTLHGPTQGVTSAEFFPFSENLIQNAAPQRISISDDKIVLETVRSSLSDPGPVPPEGLAGIVVLAGDKTTALEVLPQVESATAGLWQALLLAFLGGLILNLMPCVFPVLCLKVLSFAELAGAARRKTLHHSAAYTLGILVSFWVLAGTLIALRSGGQALGWGFQLQSPVFLAVLSFLLTGLSLNLFGVFEVGNSMMGVGQGLASKEGWAGAFFSGVLATIVATPCTAPFMGTAMGYALSQPAAVAMSVFTFLGLGLASPYIVFSLFPPLTRRLPRPGAWMVVFKQLMAFPLILTVWWLLSVLSLQASNTLVFHTLLGLIGLSAAAWLYGIPSKKPLLKTLFAVVIAAGSLAFVVREARKPQPAGAMMQTDGWAAYSESALTEARKTGRPVFIDFTAAWCITCQVNERVALETRKVKDKFAQMRVVLFKADWTNQDEAIARKLESFGRNGVPLYVLYPPGENSEPKILPQILTPDIVLSALDSLPAAKE